MNPNQAYALQSKVKHKAQVKANVKPNVKAHRKSKSSSNRLAAPASFRPTKERLLKADYEKNLQGKRVRARTLEEMKRRKIASEGALLAAETWLKDYLFALEGYSDAQFDPPSARSIALTQKYGPGNRHTFELAKAKAWARIKKIRTSLGLCSHLRLEMLLVSQLSFTALGQSFYPHLSEARGRDRASIECGMILEQLAEYYHYQSPKPEKGKITDIRSFGSFEAGNT